MQTNRDFHLEMNKSWVPHPLNRRYVPDFIFQPPSLIRDRTRRKCTAGFWPCLSCRGIHGRTHLPSAVVWGSNWSPQAYVLARPIPGYPPSSPPTFFFVANVLSFQDGQGWIDFLFCDTLPSSSSPSPMYSSSFCPQQFYQKSVFFFSKAIA